MIKIVIAIVLFIISLFHTGNPIGVVCNIISTIICTDAILRAVNKEK
jgi:hypothetical protein